MSKIAVELIKQLRDQTGAGIADCKKALEASSGDIEGAVVELRKVGAFLIDGGRDKDAYEGMVASYVHLGNHIGVLLELNCETDFVAKHSDFIKLGNNLAMHVAAAMPSYLDVADVSREEINKETEIIIAKSLAHGRQPAHLKSIVDGKMKRYYAEVCLLEQPFIKNPDITIREMLMDASVKFGEKVVVKRFTRYRVGEHE